MKIRQAKKIIKRYWRGMSHYKYGTYLKAMLLVPYNYVTEQFQTKNFKLTKKQIYTETSGGPVTITKFTVREIIVSPLGATVVYQPSKH